MSGKERVHCFADGYNFYYSLYAYAEEAREKELVWCDYYKLCEQFIQREEQSIRKIYYFSAKYHQKEEEQRQVQQAFINHHKDAYNQQGEAFKAVWGEFKLSSRQRKVRCPRCRNNFARKLSYLREKQTDVNLACTALSEAYNNFYDVALIISGDTDFSPLLEQIRHVNKKIIVLLPPTVHQTSAVFKRYETYNIELKHLKKAVFFPPPNTPEPASPY